MKTRWLKLLDYCRTELQYTEQYKNGQSASETMQEFVKKLANEQMGFTVNAQETAAAPSELVGKTATIDKHSFTGIVKQVDQNVTLVCVEDNGISAWFRKEFCEFSDPAKPEHHIVLDSDFQAGDFAVKCSCGKTFTPNYVPDAIEAWRQHANEAEAGI